MQIICDTFNIILFVTAVGSVFTIVSLAADRILHFTPPLWFSICGMAAYVLPVLSPGLYLVPPEPHSWIQGYYIACVVWFLGGIFLIVYDIVRLVLARRAIRNYRVCSEERLKAICVRCAGLVGIKKVPSVYFGTLEDPACVWGILHPVVILNETVIRQLTDTELMSVLCHELTHIKRGHIILERIYHYICILNWANPFVWISKKEFAMYCEIDCDHSAVTCLANNLTYRDYAESMVRLLGLCAVQSGKKSRGISALGFPAAKRRVELIMNRPAGIRKIITTSVLILLVSLTILFSMSMSRGHFYPYPVHRNQLEYSSNDK